MTGRLCRVGALACVVALVGVGTPVKAYLKVGVDTPSGTVAIKWTQLPVRYFVSDVGVSGVSSGQLHDAVVRSFNTWHAVASATVDSQFVGFTSASPVEEDDMSTIGFDNRPDLERTLAATHYVVDTRSGQILEADIFLNAAFPWSVAEAGEAGSYDVESITTHEIGHLFGLGHSALGETELEGGGRSLIASGAVMFPIAFSAGNITGRTLFPDDVAGISDLYPSATFRSSTGTLEGTVTLNGQGLFGAHIVALNLSTGAMIGGFALEPSGHFVIGGLAPGTYIARVEPLDDGDVGSFLSADLPVNTEFRVTYAKELATMHAGAARSGITVAVVPK